MENVPLFFEIFLRTTILCNIIWWYETSLKYCQRNTWNKKT